MPAPAERALAHLVPGFEDFTASLAQTGMVQAEHPHEKVPIGAGEERRQRPISPGNRSLFAREQRVLVALAAANLQLFALLLQDGTNPHAAVVMQEIER